MRCVVTAGPTFEPLDQARRLTNFSTGRLGCELAAFLTAQGHEVTLLLGQGATHPGPRGTLVRGFTTTASLQAELQGLAREPVDALFHAAAVSDFAFGTVFARSSDGALTPLTSGKFSTRSGLLLAELVPTPKIIDTLRGLFPNAFLVGWKYEVEGGREEALRLGLEQIARCRTNACVVNGPAYGPGFGLVHPGAAAAHLPDRPALLRALGDGLA